MALDRRLNAYREDLAEKSLEGQVAARASLPENRRGSIFRLPPFVPNLTLHPVSTRKFSWRREVIVFDRADGWAWVKAASDGYVGYLPTRRSRRPVLRRPIM